MTIEVINSAASVVIDSMSNMTDASMPLTESWDLKAYIPLFSFLGAAVGSGTGALVQAWIAMFNADRSESSRLAVRKEEIISEGVLELMRLDPHRKQDNPQNHTALRHASSIKLFLDPNREADHKLESIIDELVHCYVCIVDPNLDEELVEEIHLLLDIERDAEGLSESRRDELLDRLDEARAQILPAARSCIADAKARRLQQTIQ
jgi:hypothetical protein